MNQNLPQKKNDGGFLVRFINKIIDVVLNALHLSKYREQIVYLFVGGGTTVVDWVVFALLWALLPDLSHLPFFSAFPNAIPYTAAWAAAVLFAFWASKYFVFLEAEQKKGFSQFLKFAFTMTPFSIRYGSASIRSASARSWLMIITALSAKNGFSEEITETLIPASRLLKGSSIR